MAFEVRDVCVPVPISRRVDTFPSLVYRGALRLGLSRPEIEQIHSSIADVCEELGVKDVRLGMPNIKDVEVQTEEKVVEEAGGRRFFL